MTKGEIIYDLVWADAMKRERYWRKDRVKEIDRMINERVINAYNEGLEQGQRIKQAQLHFGIMQLLEEDASRNKNRGEIQKPIHREKEV